MNCLTTLFAICCLTVTAKARPGYDHYGSHNLGGIPDTRDYSILKYPKYDILELGEYSKGHLPGDEIYVNKHVIEHVPEPYPVKVPVPHPYPVHIEKPYPVVETKYVKVPHAVPYEIVKQVPIPVEVPKPYPVPVDSGHNGDSYHAGSQQSFGIQNHTDGLENAGGEVQHVNSFESQGDEGYQVHQEGQ
ncbi:uncharacterized protein [Leptinotarsa decemlineata]|uniref:uncharacterized protein n=1 Tax=Leptinotarsa decemlineata TaxID=7539 RepID=UPI003D306BCD